MLRTLRMLERSNFVTMLQTLPSDLSSRKDSERLNSAYNQFIDQIQRISKYKKRSKLDSLRMLARIQEQAIRSLNDFSRKDSIQYSLLKSAIALIGFEQKLIYLQLKYPGIADVQQTRYHSPFKLSKEYTNSDLMELLTALHAIHFFCLSDDSPAPFVKITREFESFCNVKIKNPDNCRWAIVNRKNRLTHMIDLLKNALIDLNQK